MEIEKYIDLETALARVRGNKVIYAKMLNLFTGSGEFAAFDAALAEGDTDGAARIAHGIKGMTGNLGFTVLYETSAHLTEQLKTGVVDKDELNLYYSALKNTLECVERLKQEWA